jgi:hypothetical protein
LVVSMLGLAVSRLGVRFDGALDLHTTKAPVALSVALLDQAVAFPLTALAFWISARIAAPRTRIVDMLGAERSSPFAHRSAQNVSGKARAQTGGWIPADRSIPTKAVLSIAFI